MERLTKTKNGEKYQNQNTKNQNQKIGEKSFT